MPALLQPEVRENDPDQIIADFEETAHVPTTYVNNKLSAVGSHSQIDASVKSLLADLESASDVASKKLNMLVDDMLRTAPRLGYDVEVLRGELQTLHSVVGRIEPKRETLAGMAGSSIQKLALLEVVKKRMQETQKILDEAQAWKPPEAIEDTIGALITAKEYASASKQIVHYEELLYVYKGTSEYPRRKAVLERIRKRLTEVKQDGSKKVSLDLARSSLDTQRSVDSSSAEDGSYSSFIRRAFKS